ncbi:acyl carrier protein [Nostoc sp. FACHB-110]|uniref:acyl carrier protein n=1 Tax=Nostoc sp. FACHB-110 TaxID=2692834 RepID=UPI001685F44A|nr:acyl carrier protein [Nostoc sp. FACHB-110]MBD2439002.1 acyl carrier protein [Nostoc sp. FACHB-110]
MSYQNLNAEEIQAWLIAKVAEELNFDPDEIDIEEPFARYGLNSMTAVSLSADLEDWLKIKLPATLAWDYPTIIALSEYLENEISTLVA